MEDEEILALPDIERIMRSALAEGVPVLERHLCEAYRAGHIDGFSKGVARHWESTSTGTKMREGDGDSLERLLEDVEKTVALGDCVYWGRGENNNQGCDGCPSDSKDLYCYKPVLEDVARRLHALMPHDMDGREIKVGDTIERVGSGLQIHVTDVMPLPVSIDNDAMGRLTVGVPPLWRVMEPDSWERLEEDAYHLVMSEYLDAPEDDVKDLVRRAKALAGVE